MSLCVNNMSLNCMMCEPALIPTLSRHLLQQTMARAQGEQDPLNTHDASLPFDVKSFEGDGFGLSEDQQERLAAFRRSKLDQAKMKRVYENIAGHKPNPAMIIVLCGIAKLFVGDLTEAAVMISAAHKEERPLRREHIMAAYQQLKRKQEAPIEPTRQKRLRL